MLKKADTSPVEFLKIFAQTGAQAAFISPTPTGLAKSIMDATFPVRQLLQESGIHDYSEQRQGPEHKKIVPAHFVTSAGLIDSVCSLYRPRTKSGDPRIWFRSLTGYANAHNLLAIVPNQGNLYVFNLSDQSVSESILGHSGAYDLLKRLGDQQSAIEQDLIARIRAIHARGFLPSITVGDPGVGDTLEHALGIRRNNSKLPDYMGIELKTSRTTRNGKSRPMTRSTLFAQVPHNGMTYKDIVRAYGKVQTPRGRSESRLQIQDTVCVRRKNSYGLKLDLDESAGTLNLVHVGSDGSSSFISSWLLKFLQQRLAEKHHETFWIRAASEVEDGIEYFRYDFITHTRKPNVSLLPTLFENNVLTIDLVGYFREDGSFRDHGVLFKIRPQDRALLFGETEVFDLRQS